MVKVRRLLAALVGLAALSTLLLVRWVHPSFRAVGCTPGRDVAGLYMEMWISKYRSGAFLSAVQDIAFRNETLGRARYTIGFIPGRAKQRPYVPFPSLRCTRRWRLTLWPREARNCFAQRRPR